MKKHTTHFLNLEPDVIFKSAEDLGLEPTGRFTQLNSYENRVFHLELEDDPEGVVGKFYRPGRWSREAIQEEHQFLLDLQSLDIPAVAPLSFSGETVFKISDFYYTYFPRIRARMPDEMMPQDLVQVGRLLARIHIAGAKSKSKHRQEFIPDWSILEDLEEWIYPELKNQYLDIAENALEAIQDILHDQHFTRIHGDCHRGNLLLNTEQRLFILDFDDFLMGPRVQDFWMLISGDEDLAESELENLRKGYEELSEFPDHELELIPYLRARRILTYSHWIAMRYGDPAFQQIFPDYRGYSYWLQELEQLKKLEL